MRCGSSRGSPDWFNLDQRSYPALSGRRRTVVNCDPDCNRGYDPINALTSVSHACVPGPDAGASFRFMRCRCPVCPKAAAGIRHRARPAEPPKPVLHRVASTLAMSKASARVRSSSRLIRRAAYHGAARQHLRDQPVQGLRQAGNHAGSHRRNHTRSGKAAAS
jgi:hypothetical protein